MHTYFCLLEGYEGASATEKDTYIGYYVGGNVATCNCGLSWIAAAAVEVQEHFTYVSYFSMCAYYVHSYSVRDS